VALYVLCKGNPLGQLHEALRMMEPSFINGSVF
jgi:hypothetical protein